MRSTTADRSPDVDAAALERVLRRDVSGEVLFDEGSRALYATDASNYRQVPIGVVCPRTKDDVRAAVAACREAGAPLLSRGGGTSLAGQGCNVAVILDMSRHYNKVLSLDPARREARVQPGLVLDALQKAAKPHGLRFGPDPATHSRCTLGGMLGNNSCGVHAQMAGKAVDNTISLEVLTYGGDAFEAGETSEEAYAAAVAAGGGRAEIYKRLRRLRDAHADLIRRRYPILPRRVSGYNLDSLLPENGFHVGRALVGSESTCVTILEATLRLVPEPKATSLLVLGYRDVFASADHVPEVLKAGPIALEGLDAKLLDGLKKKGGSVPPGIMPDGQGWLLVELAGETPEEAAQKARKLGTLLENLPGGPSVRLFEDEKLAKKIWEVRESGLGATAFIPGERDTWEGWEDSAVPPERLGSYLRGLKDLYNRYGYSGALYGHFGMGCVHTRIDFELTTSKGLETFRSFLDDAAELVVRHGGSLSGEHGDGQSKAELLPKMFGAEMTEVFREFKEIWDPAGRMNPGKIASPYRILENLRLGTEYAPPDVRTHFDYPDDGGSFARAALRCVGVGACRREGGDGVMCPSYQVTRDEKHSTRGRAHLLFEMLRGETVKGGWRDESVREALDLCLACKGCKSDCPVNVDMATYKAEFLSHYYAGRLRPRNAYAFGLIRNWSRLASLAPGLVNAAARGPLRGALKWAAGMDPRRNIPLFAPTPFTSRFRRRPVRPAGGKRVLLWPDTFNDHFHPETLAAAAGVLERRGAEVVLPPRPLCCGRPLYDYGMLGPARKLLAETLSVLRSEIRAGTELVVLEPSCASVFRDELRGLFPRDEDAKRLRGQTRTLAEWLDERREGAALPRLAGRAVLQGHCHDKSVLDFPKEESYLKGLGLDVQAPEPGCCGMAGAFGFEIGHYDVSMACGEKALLPAARGAGPGVLLVADGFSCREQILHGSGRLPMHFAEVVALADARQGERE
jgi:FAD/FMN-containing dehydrogenase/Fe-S oxidoreductase